MSLEYLLTFLLTNSELMCAALGDLELRDIS